MEPTGIKIERIGLIWKFWAYCFDQHKTQFGEIINNAYCQIQKLVNTNNLHSSGRNRMIWVPKVFKRHYSLHWLVQETDSHCRKMSLSVYNAWRWKFCTHRRGFSSLWVLSKCHISLSPQADWPFALLPWKCSAAQQVSMDGARVEYCTVWILPSLHLIDSCIADSLST